MSAVGDVLRAFKSLEDQIEALRREDLRLERKLLELERRPTATLNAPGARIVDAGTDIKIRSEIQQVEARLGRAISRAGKELADQARRLEALELREVRIDVHQTPWAAPPAPADASEAPGSTETVSTSSATDCPRAATIGEEGQEDPRSTRDLVVGILDRALDPVILGKAIRDETIASIGGIADRIVQALASRGRLR